MVKSPTAREPGHECAGGLHPSDHPQLHNGSVQIGAVEAGWMIGGSDGVGGAGGGGDGGGVSGAGGGGNTGGGADAKVWV